jgi:two-component system, NarL family, nitrate/nitrite response regulator NarP
MVFPFLDVSGINDDPLESLSPRERELLAELGSGRTNAELARNLGVSVNTVKFHLRNLFDKLQVRSRAQAVQLWHESRR